MTPRTLKELIVAIQDNQHISSPTSGETARAFYNCEEHQGAPLGLQQLNKRRVNYDSKRN